ncbi:MAG: flagellar hook assembly protein FlgD [Oscillospiraceae bacterium]
MADELLVPLSSSEQIQSNYQKYKDKFKDSTEALVNSDTFLTLLVAEMTNQDPMEPTSNTEFVTQMAQFTSLTYNKDAAQYSKSNYASSLVGKMVTASKMDGSTLVTKTGVVESVMKSGDNYTVKIDGVSFDISKITSIATDTSSTVSDPISGNSLGSLIASASMMIGMSATVNPAVEGGSALDSGVIQSVQVKNGTVQVIINDTAYNLEDIVEVAYPTVEIGGEDDTSVGGVTDEATDELDELMDIIDKINESEQDRLDEEAEEYYDEELADDYFDEDIEDLEDFI